MVYGAELFFSLFNNLAIFIALVTLYGHLLGQIKLSVWFRRQAVFGLFFGVFAIGCMYAKIPVFEGVIVDQRNAIVALSGVFGGPFSAMISAFITGAYRIYLGGSGVLAGVIGICLSAIAGTVLNRFPGCFSSLQRAALSTLIATIIILPGFLFVKDIQTGWELLKAMALPYGSAIYCGIFLVGLLLNRVEERHHLELSFHESEEKLRLFIEHAPASLAMFDLKMNYISVSQRWKFDYGLEHHDIIGKPHCQTLPDISSHWQKSIQQGLSGKVITNKEDEFEYPDGTKVWLQWEMRPWYKSDGAVGGIVIFTADLTERKEVEIALAKNKERFERSLENIPDVVAIYDTELRIQYINLATRTVIGRPPSDFINKTEQELWPPEIYHKYLPALIESKESKTIQSVETEIELPDGNIKHLQITYIPLLGAKGDLNEILGVTVDLTEIKQANRELTRFASHLQNQIEKERNEISREIHDDFGQTLSALKLDIGWMKKRLHDQQALNEKMIDMEKMIRETVKTVKRICSGLRPALLDDMGLIPALEWLSSQFEKRNKINLKFMHELDAVYLDKKQSISVYRIIQEALTNISRHSKAKNVEIIMKSERKEIVITIHDDGIGMKEVDSNKQIKSFGILGMKERAATLNGKLDIVSNDKDGTMIILVFKIEDKIN